MNILTCNGEYTLVEFNFFVNVINDTVVSSVELLLNCSIDEFVESDFESIFVIEAEKQTHVFSQYVVSEYYEENGLLKVILTK